MRFSSTLLLACVILTQTPAKAIIFGTDDRLERFQLKDTSTLSYSKSTAALMLTSQLTPLKDQNGTYSGYRIDMKKPGNGPVPDSSPCPRAFVGQPQITAYCSSTLIGEDLLLTAGHCLNRGEDIILPNEICKDTVAVFDYAYSSKEGRAPLRFPKKNVYHCKKVELYYDSTKLDIAVIRLDRKVEGREVMKLKNPASLKMQNGQTLYNSGYPKGMPNKTVLTASFLNYHNGQNTARFYTDVMGGSSGSSVIDPITREIVGVLVSSDCADTMWDAQKQCFYEPVFNGQCNGVEMTLLERTSHLINLK